MKSGRGALCIFVKTPALSPVKTRLARIIGDEAARQFYVLCCQTLARTLRNGAGRDFDVYWAVAESEGMSDPLWQGFPRLFQGPGDLGDRQARVYAEALARHSFAVLIGADLPHLRIETVDRAVKELAAQPPPFVLGPAEDGGYYLFAGRTPLAPEIWRGVAYGTERARHELSERLRSQGVVANLPDDFDIDEEADLRRLSERLLQPDLCECSEFADLRAWLERWRRRMSSS